MTRERYQQRLMQLSLAFKIKHPSYAKRHEKINHDNAWPHIAKFVKPSLEALQWDVLKPKIELILRSPQKTRFFFQRGIRMLHER